MIVEVRELRQLLSLHPFHNLQRLLRKHGVSVPCIGGDCFQLANLAAHVYYGKVVTCRYKKSGDYHWVADVGNSFIDLTAKELFFYKEDELKFAVQEESAEVYFNKRTSVLDSIFLLRTYAGGIYIEVTGNVTKANGIIISDTVEETAKIITETLSLSKNTTDLIVPYLIQTNNVE